MAADGEMAVDAAVPERADQTREARQVELEDERKTDDQRVARASNAQDVLNVRLEVEHDDLVAISPQHRREIAKAQIFLVQEADQKDRPRCVARPVEQRVADDGRLMPRFRHRNAPPIHRFAKQSAIRTGQPRGPQGS